MYRHLDLGTITLPTLTPPPTRSTSRSWRRYAKIICHLRSDVNVTEASLPDSASIHYLVRKHYRGAFDNMVWEEAVYKLLQILRTETYQHDAHNPWLAFFDKAAIQLRRATFGSHIWVH